MVHQTKKRPEVERQDDDVETTLKERGAHYGSFHKVAGIAQDIRKVLRAYENLWIHNLSDEEREALDMIATKMARAMTSDANGKLDSYLDISGYSELARRSIDV